MDFVEIMLAIFAFMIGACFASFFGVVCCRVPQDLSIVKPNSRCDSCGHELSFFENVPIFSYIFLLGKCRKCHNKIPLDGFISEIIGGLSLLIVYLHYGISYELIFIIPITLIMLLIAMYDHYTNTILDIFWIIFLILVVGFRVFDYFVLGNTDYIQYLIGCGICVVFFSLIKLIFYFILKQDALGTGDIIIMGIGGLLMGYKTILVSLLIASILGSIIELILLFTVYKNKDEGRMIPFCPYLVLGIFVATLYGNSIVDWVMEVIEHAIL